MAACAICINEGNIKTMYNDCIIESLEKIKFHYMSLKSKLNENEQLAKTLKDENAKLKETINEYEENEKTITKKRRTASCEDDNDSEISFSQNVPKSIAQKSIDDLNMALNFDDEFDLSFIPNTQDAVERKMLKKPLSSATKATTTREPLKALPTKSVPSENKPLNVVKQESKSSDDEDSKQVNKSVAIKKSSSWIAKENELSKKLVLGSVQKRSNRSLKHMKQEHKTTSMSLKPGKLRQSRLQLDVSKNASNNFSDSTFCDEAIEDSPTAESSLKRINSSKQWQLRNISSKITKPEDDSILNFTKSSPKKSTSQSPKQNESLDSSSVVMFTPASQDIIFLDESESFNIESMDLLKGLMNPTENMGNLKKIESNGIKMLQKTNAGQVKNIPSKSSDFEEKQKKKSTFKTEHEFAKPKTVEKTESKRLTSEKENSSFANNNNFKLSPVKTEKSPDRSKKPAKVFDIDCDECQSYIKYLGGRLTDEQIEQHIRNCTNHKKRIDNNLTPDGFWDPMIKPFASDDPRNLTIVDDPIDKNKC